jgi:hypothetical protein
VRAVVGSHLLEYPCLDWLARAQGFRSDELITEGRGLSGYLRLMPEPASLNLVLVTTLTEGMAIPSSAWWLSSESA